MDSVIELAEKLAKSLYNSEHYQEYLGSLTIIEQDSQLKILLDNYRLKQLEQAVIVQSGADVPEDQRLSLANEYSALMLDVRARNFLEKEDRFLKLFSEVLAIINKTVKIDMDFWGET